MDPKELEKVCCNLRSVTQSCKGGVPLNRLSLDYRALVGKQIPSFGHNSLEAFILSIPQFVRLKTVNGKKMVEAVADKTTAHIANMISKQKNSKTGLVMKVPGKIPVPLRKPAPLKKYVPAIASAPVKEQFKGPNSYSMAHPYPPKAANSNAGLTVPSNNVGSAALSSINDYSLPVMSSNFELMLETGSEKSDVQNGTDDGTESLNGTSQNGSENCIDDSCSEGSSWELAKNPWKQKSTFAEILKQNSYRVDSQGKGDIHSSSQVIDKKTHSDPKMIELEKAVCINLRAIAISSKTGVLVDNLQTDYQRFVGGYIPFDILGYESLEDFLETIPDVIKLVRKSNGQLVAEGVPDSSTSHISKLISKQKAVQKKSNQKLAGKPLLKPAKIKTSNQSNMQKPIMPLKASQVHENSNTVGIDIPPIPVPILGWNATQLTKSEKDDAGNSFRWSGKTLGSFPCIRENITNAHFSTLTGLHNLLFAESYMDTLKEKILNFGGYLFLQNSEEWKKREFLFSVLPLDGLKEYLNLLCVKCSGTENKHTLLNTLMSFIASPETGLIDPEKVGSINLDTDWFKKCQEKDDKLAKVIDENNKLKAELLKLKSESKSSNEKSTTKVNKKETDQTSKIDTLMSELEKLKEEKLEADTKVKKIQKEKGQLEFQLNSLKHEMKVVDKQRKDLVSYLSTLSNEKDKMKTFFLSQLASISDTLYDLVDSFDDGSKTVQDVKKGKKKLATQTGKIISLKEKLEKL